ncbi:NAD-dependent epimerase/dehydratase family protein [Candidatus Pacearchaeota archaeon]|nr:NAD-dependent epimerase/dehydratase family protein [Candidatus Pacearchaeota archaeon]
MEGKIIVTGSKSGLGRYLAEKLNVIGISRETSDAEWQQLRERGVATIIHCAFNSKKPSSSEEVAAYVQDNLLLTQHLLEIPHEKFIFISTIDVYPTDGKIHDEAENISADALACIYPLTKFLSEALVRKLSPQALILRCSALLGPYSRKNSLLKIIEDTFPTLTLSPDAEFNYVLHSDLLKIVTQALSQNIVGVYNVVATRNIALKEVAELLGKNVTFGQYRYATGNIAHAKLLNMFPFMNKSSKEVILEFKQQKLSPQKTKVLICGVSGFIGRNIAERLAGKENLELYGTYHHSQPFSLPGLQLKKADLCNEEEVRCVVSGMDVIIQAAATTSGAKDIVTRPYFHVTDNAIMNSLIFRAAHDCKVKQVVFFSCSVMYQPSERPVLESDFDANKELFKSYFGVGWTKVYIEKMCEFYSRIGETRYTVLRHSNIYGPHDKFDLEKSHVFGATMTKVLQPKDGKIIVWGTGEEERDLLYVSDLVDAVILALEKQQSQFGLYNIGYGSSVSIRELVKKIVDAAGGQLAIAYDTSKPTIKTTLALNCNKAKQELGWQPSISLDEGIRRTMEWYKKNVL